MKKLISLLLAIMLCLALTACGGGEKTVTLNILNWEDYLEPELIKKFESENPDIKIKYKSMINNETMYAVLSRPDSVYDICFPSDYMVERMKNEGLLYEYDYSTLSNYGNVPERFRGLPYDPDNRYSVPYTYGMLGILYNTEMVDDVVDSWDILWNLKYANQIIMYDSIRDGMAVALKREGFSLNTTDQDELDKAYEALIAQKKPLVKAYLTDDVKDTMIRGGAALAVVYSGDAVLCIQDNPNLRFAVPREGTNLYFDAMVIMKNAKNPEAALRFINFILDADNAAVNCEYTGFTAANDAAIELMDPEITQIEGFSFTEEELQRGEVFRDLGELLRLYDDIWTRVKNA